MVGPSNKMSATENERSIMEHIELQSLSSRALLDDTARPIETTASHATSHHDPDEKLKLGQAIKRFPRMVIYCMSLNIVVVGWGYDLIIVGSITGVEPFQDDYGEIYQGQRIIPALWLSLWQAAIPLGMTIGSVFAGTIQDRIGRRMALMVSSVLSAIGVAVLFFSYLSPTLEGRRGMFFAGKLIQGIAIGSLKVTALTYISETAPASLRGSIMGMLSVSNLVGQFLGSIIVLVANNVVGKAAYLGAFGSQWVLAVAPFIISLAIPESPAWLLSKGEDEKALVMARRLFGVKGEPEQAVARMRVTVDEEKALVSETSFLTCFTKTHIRRTMIVMGANLYSMLFGLDLLSKASYFLQLLGMASNTSLILLIVGIVLGVASNSGGVWMLSRYGRRPLVLITLTAAGVIWLAVGISESWRDRSLKNKNVVNFVAAANVAVIVVCGLGVWPAAYAIMGETSSLRLRAKTQALGGVSQQATSVVMSFCLPYVYNPDAGDAGARTGFVFAGMCLVGVVASYFVLPEMQSRTSGEIDRMFNMKLPPRQFKRWKSDGTDDGFKGA